jgi:hypothetical protein
VDKFLAALNLGRLEVVGARMRELRHLRRVLRRSLDDLGAQAKRPRG